MNKSEIVAPPVAHTAMLIRKAVSEVFEAIIDPAITSHFWISHSHFTVLPTANLIVIQWPGYSGPTTVTWTLTEVKGGTFVDVEETGWTGTGDDLVKFVRDSTGGFTWVLAGMKAFLEHGLELNLIADRFPKGIDRR